MRSVDLDGFRYSVADRGSGPAVLLIHGFTGRGSSWGELPRALRRAGWRTIAPDLPGHGASAIPEPPERGSVERIATDLAELAARLGASPADVVGYSLGARIALRLAIAHPSGVRRLVLESPSAGIADPDERAARRGADELLARRIERDGIESFVDGWERLPIFASQGDTLSAARAAALRRQRLRNRPAGLAASLRGAGQGSMESLFDRLGSVSVPALVVAGALDPVGLARAGLVAQGLPNARLVVVPDAGHAPHLERPSVFRHLVEDFLVVPPQEPAT